MLDQQSIQDARLFDSTLVVYTNLLTPIAPATSSTGTTAPAPAPLPRAAAAARAPVAPCPPSAPGQ